MKVYGLSQSNQNIVDDFETHSDVLSVIKSLIADPSKYKKLTEDAVKAIALVDEEKARRNEAVDLIEQSKKIQNELRKQNADLHEKKAVLEMLHNESIKKVIDEKERADAHLSTKKRLLDDRESKINSLHLERENYHVGRSQDLYIRESKLNETERKVDEKLKELARVSSDIEAFKAKMA